MGIHDDHRKRVKQRYLQEGEAAFHDVQLLELYLFYAIPRKDVNPLAHLLLERFGSLAGVMDASKEALLQVPGVGEQVVLSLRLARDLVMRSQRSRQSVGGEQISGLQDAAELLGPYFFGARTEKAYLLLLDARGLVMECRQVGEGDSRQAVVDELAVIERVRSAQPALAVLAHNHPQGLPQPSEADREATARLEAAIGDLGTELADHLIFGDGCCYSLKTGQLLIIEL